MLPESRVPKRTGKDLISAPANGDSDPISTVGDSLNNNGKPFYEWWLNAPFTERHRYILSCVLASSEATPTSESLEIAHFNATAYAALMLREVRDSKLLAENQFDGLRDITLGHGLMTANFLLEIFKQRPELLGDEQAFSVFLAAILHDAGKMDNISDFQNGATIDPSVKQDHPLISLEFIKMWELHVSGFLPQFISDVALKHHLMPDGSGYPTYVIQKIIQDGEVMSKQIPLEPDKRPLMHLVQIADAITAMLDPDRTTNYRRTLSEALVIVSDEAQAGKYDLALVNSLKEIILGLEGKFVVQPASSNYWLVDDENALMMWMFDLAKDKNDKQKLLRLVGPDQIWETYNTAFNNSIKIISKLAGTNSALYASLAENLRIGDQLAEVIVRLHLSDPSVLPNHGIYTLGDLEDFLLGALLSKIGKSFPPVPLIRSPDYRDQEQADLNNKHQHVLIAEAKLWELKDKLRLQQPLVPQIALKYIRAQGERPDGSGGPRGIWFSNISLESLVVQVEQMLLLR